MRMKFPSKAQLRTVSVELIDRYVEWLYGPKVWGLATLGPDGQALSTPTINHVIAYDLQIRKKVAEQMNLGHDMAAALAHAQGDPELRQVHFLSPVSIAINTPDCRACTAPCLEDRARPQSVKTKATDGGGASASAGDGTAVGTKAAKSKAKRSKRASKAKQLAKQKRKRKNEKRTNNKRKKKKRSKKPLDKATSSSSGLPEDEKSPFTLEAVLKSFGMRKG